MADGGSLLPAPENAVELKVFQGGGLDSSGGGATSSLLPMPEQLAELQVFKGGGEGEINEFLARNPQDRTDVTFRGLTLDELIEVFGENISILLVNVQEPISEVKEKNFKDTLLYTVSVRIKGNVFEYLKNADESIPDLGKSYFYDDKDGKELLKTADQFENKPFIILPFTRSIVSKRDGVNPLFVEESTNAAAAPAPATAASTVPAPAAAPPPVVAPAASSVEIAQPATEELPAVPADAQGIPTYTELQQVIQQLQTQLQTTQTQNEEEKDLLTAQLRSLEESIEKQKAEAIVLSTSAKAEVLPSVSIGTETQTNLTSTGLDDKFKDYQAKVKTLEARIKSLQEGITNKHLPSKQQEAILTMKTLLDSDELKEAFVPKLGGERSAGIAAAYLLRNSVVQEEELNELKAYLEKAREPISFLSHHPGIFLPTTPLFQKAYAWHLGQLTEKVLGKIAANALRRKMNVVTVKKPEVVTVPDAKTIVAPLSATPSSKADTASAVTTASVTSPVTLPFATVANSQPKVTAEKGETAKKLDVSMIAIKRKQQQKTQEKSTIISPPQVASQPQTQQEPRKSAGLRGEQAGLGLKGGSRQVKKHITKTRRLTKVRQTINGGRGRVRTSRKVRLTQTN